MFLLRLITLIAFIMTLFCNSAFCAENQSAIPYKIKDLVVDNSDKLILIQGQGNYKQGNFPFVLKPQNSDDKNAVNIISDISTFTINAPTRYVVDIPNAVLVNPSRTYKIQNSSIIQSIHMSQFSISPNIVRVVFTLNNGADAKNFKTLAFGSDIIVQYVPNIVYNKIKYKFYTPTGDQDKNTALQNTGAILTFTNEEKSTELMPSFTAKYYLSRINQTSNGLILRGMGAISLQRINYFDEDTKAEAYIDNATLSTNLENKTFIIPCADKEIKTALSVSKVSPKKIKLTLTGEKLKDYRFIVSPDGQSLFICHNSFVVNTIFSQNTTKVTSYKITRNQNGYVLFDLAFSQGIAYNVFELNDNFYLDINNLFDYSQSAFDDMLKTTDLEIQALKIASDKTRFIIPAKYLNFAYANIESNAKSITLCFKEKPGYKSATIDTSSKNNSIEQGSVIYIPKEEDNKIQKPTKKKGNLEISAMKKVVLDPGHGGTDTGAIGGGHYEKTITLDVAKLVYDKLSKKNVYVYMTRSKDVTLSLEDRVNYSNETNPDIFVSIHVNSTVASDPLGLETYYFKDDSIDLAKKIHEHFASEKNLKKWDTKDRGVLKSRFYVINHTEAPSALIEIGFISNDEERSKLLTKQRQNEIADSIAKGILEYLKVK